MGHIIIWKYREDSGDLKFYFDNDGTIDTAPKFRDKIKLNSVPSGALPYIDVAVEHTEGLMRKKYGDFTLKLNYSETTLSYNGVNLYNFINDSTFPNKFLVLVYYNDGLHFSGTFTTGEIEGDLTYSKNPPYLEVYCKGIWKEFQDSFSVANKGTRLAQNDMTLETYIPYHFDSNYTLDGYLFGSQYYAQKVGDLSVRFSGYMQTQCNNSGANFNSVPRWETFRELEKGIGFMANLVAVNPETAYTGNHLKYNLKIEWLDEISAKPQIDIKVIDWKPSYRVDNRKWVFAGYRHHIPNTGNYTHINGVLFGKDETLSVDSTDYSTERRFIFWINSGANPDLGYKPEILIYIKANLGGSDEGRYFNRDSEVIGVDLNLYPNPENLGAKFRAGSMSYSSFVVATNYNHLPVQNYLANQYRRYLLGSKRIYRMTIVYDGTQNLNLYNYVPLTINGEPKDYFIYAVNSIDLENFTANITLMEI